jgi:hypothetical protein
MAQKPDRPAFKLGQDRQEKDDRQQLLKTVQIQSCLGKDRLQGHGQALISLGFLHGFTQPVRPSWNCGAM